MSLFRQDETLVSAGRMQKKLCLYVIMSNKNTILC